MYDATPPEADADPPRVGAGWYADPLGEWPLRWWTGTSWTVWVFDGVSVHGGPLVHRRHLDQSDLGHLGFVRGVFLPELSAHGGLTREQARQATDLVRELTAEAHEAHPAEASPAPAAPPGSMAALPQVTGWAEPGRSSSAPAPTPPRATPAHLPAAPRPTPTPTGSRSGPASGWTARTTPAPAPAWRATPTWTPAPTGGTTGAPDADMSSGTPPPRAHEPGSVALWWERTRESVRSDLTVHGLAYLGVLLFFVGAFGLVAFAFGDVQPELRPLAEAVIAVVPFGAAALLVRRGATIAGRALEVAGGLLLPIMVITSFLDGVDVPPDLTGTPLVIAATTACAAITGGYALWSLRHHDSALRYVVAPAGWLTAAMVSLGLGRPIPSGNAVAIPGSAQVAAVLAVLVLTVAWARLAPRGHLAAPTCAAAVPGSFVLVLLAALTWIREPDPWPAAVLASGILAVAAVELLSADTPPADRLAPALAGTLEPALWAATVIAVVATTGLAWGYAVGALGFLVIVELAGRARRPVWALALPAAGLLWCSASLLAQPWLAVGTLAVASAWALVRRATPFQSPGAAVGLNGAAVLLPLGTLAALAYAQDPATALLVGAALLLGTVSTRRAVEGFWTVACTAWLLTLTVAASAAWAADLIWETGSAGEPWLLVGSVALLCAAAVAGPLAPEVRTWLASALGAWTWVLASWAAPLPDAARGVVLAAAALALVASSQAWAPRGASVARALGLSGHVLGLVALPLSGTGWGLTAALALATAQWAITTIADARGTSPVGDWLATLGPPARYLPPVMLASGIVATSLVALWQARPDDWTSVAVLVLSGIAIAMGASTRTGLPRRVGRTFGWFGFALPIAGLLIAPTAASQMVALGALIGAVVAVAPGYRWTGMTWTAWAAVAPLLGLAAAQWWDAFAAEPAETQASLVFLTVGSALLVGTAAAELRSGPWVPRWWPTRTTLIPPAVLGGAEALTGLALVVTGPVGTVQGWILVGTGAAALVLALLTRIGVLAGAAVLLAWAGAQVLITPSHEIPPLVGVAAVAVLLVVAEVCHRSLPDRTWSRWDVPIGLAAVPIALVAVATAQGTPDEVATDVLLGLITLAVALRLRALVLVALPLSMIGIGMILAGASAAGPWWLAAALITLTAALTASAIRASGEVKAPLQLVAALSAGVSWASIVAAAELSVTPAADLTMWGAGALGLALAAVNRATWVTDGWVRIWGGLSALTVVACALACWVGALELAPTPAAVGGLALVTAALVIAANPLRLPVLRDTASATGLAALLTALEVLDASPTGWVLTLVAVGLASAIGTLTLRGDARRTSLEVGPVATALAAAVAVSSSGTPMLLVATLVAGAAQAAAIGSALRNVLIQALSPLLACAAWLVFATESLTGSVELWTIPIGLALLVVVGLWRRDRIQHGLPAAAPEVSAVEVVGVLLLVGASLVLMVTDSLLHVLPALVLGTGVAAWGVITRVRRRVLMGSATVLAALLLLVAVPLVRLLPEWQGASLWILLLGLGITALLIAALMERGRAAARSAAGRFREVTADWE